MFLFEYELKSRALLVVAFQLQRCDCIESRRKQNKIITSIKNMLLHYLIKLLYKKKKNKIIVLIPYEKGAKVLSAFYQYII